MSKLSAFNLRFLLGCVLWVCCLIFEVAESRADDNSVLLYRQALRSFFTHDFETSAQLFLEGLSVGEDDETNGKAYYYLGESYLQLRDEKKANEAFQKSYELAPDTEQGVTALAESKRLINNAKLVLRVCNSANHGDVFVATNIKVDPDSDVWSIDGWWTISEGQCQNVGEVMSFGSYDNRELYYTAEAKDHTVWPGAAGTATKLCLPNTKYHRISSPGYNCAPGEQLWPFFKITWTRAHVGTNVVTSYLKEVQTTVATGTGTWLVFAGSWPDLNTATQRLSFLKAKGFDAKIIKTDDYPKLSPGFFAVVFGPFEKDVAQSKLSAVQAIVSDAFIKQGG